jgi:hypothetical protein
MHALNHFVKVLEIVLHIPFREGDIAVRYTHQSLLPTGNLAGLPIATDHEKVCDPIGISVGDLFHPREITDRLLAQKLEAIQGLLEYNPNMVGDFYLTSLAKKIFGEITGGENEETIRGVGTGQKKYVNYTNGKKIYS